MMMTVRMVGHHDDYVLADVLRLFFGTISRPAPDVLAAGQPASDISGGEDWVLISECQQSTAETWPPVTKPTDQDLLARPSDDEGLVSDSAVKVSTRFWLNQAAIDQNQSPFQIFENYVAPNDVRRELKRQLYQMLERITDTHFPWGSLTGVRPTQIVEQLLAATGSVEDTRADLIDRWRLSSAKADLAIRTSLSEQRVLSQLPSEDPLIYAGIPFCPSRCAYCSFIAQDAHHREEWLSPYVDAMIEEARRVFAILPVHSHAFYLGGGTPTSLPDALLRKLLEGLKGILPLRPDAEITIEAGRPDTITAEKLAILREFGATRICINPQTFNQRTLDRIGRRHSVEQVFTAMDLARRAGFNHINMDLIAGLPGESPDDFAYSVEQLLSLEPESATVHTLAVKRSSRFAQEMKPEELESLAINKPDPALIEMVALAQERLIEAELYPYYLYRQKDVASGLENVGFARIGHECRYNVGMMSDRLAVIGLGSGAITKRVDGRKVTRAPNDKDIAHYIARLDELVQRKTRLFTD
jgi:coproporphyrinogen dehydrogenase HemZ